MYIYIYVYISIHIVNLQHVSEELEVYMGTSYNALYSKVLTGRYTLASIYKVAAQDSS